MIIPTLRQLQYLVALGDTGSFSRAAEACHVTQPTLSAGIKELEDLLGVKLAEREPRGAKLTHAGELAVARANALINDAHSLVQSVQSAGALLTGPFHLGAIPTIAPFVLPATVRALSEQYPDLKLYLHEEKTPRLIDQLRTRTLDAALIALPWDVPGIDMLPLFDDEFLFAAPAAHPLARKNGLSPEDLSGENLLLLEDGHCLRDHALSICPLSAARSALPGALAAHAKPMPARLAKSSRLTPGIRPLPRPEDQDFILTKPLPEPNCITRYITDYGNP